MSVELLTSRFRSRSANWLLIVIALLSAMGCLATGSVEIPASDVWHSLTGGQVARQSWRLIVMQARLPIVLTSATAGCALAVTGLLLQTCLRNPLAGPSILGVSTGASLGVALVVMSAGSIAMTGAVGYSATLLGAMAGAAVVMVLLLMMAMRVKSNMMLLIVGVLISYFASSAISLLNYYSSQQSVYSYTIWGLGSFSALSLERSGVFALFTWPFILGSLFLVKPLNSLLLGGRYAASMGMNLKRVRVAILVVAGILTAFVTAFCGPIGFLGLVAPHVALMLRGTSNHRFLMPCTILCGGAMALACSYISVAFGGAGILPINAITPIVGVPIVLYVILSKRWRM